VCVVVFVAAAQHEAKANGIKYGAESNYVSFIKNAAISDIADDSNSGPIGSDS
jgi:hypothetical protein